MGQSTGRKLRSINPFDGSLIGELEVPTAPQVAEMMERCREAAREWGRIPVEERIEAISPLRELLLRRSEEICELVSREVGEPIAETPITEIHPALESISYYSEVAPALLADRKVEYRSKLKSGKVGLNRYEPVGVVAIISSWIFPFSIPFTQIIPALIAGNGVIFKPSEHAPLTGAMIADLLGGALPEGLFCLAVGDGEVGREIIRAGPDRIVFTGRRETGRKVMIEAAERLLPLTLCLSGKGTAIVLEDADLDRAAVGIAYGAFLNSGQACGRIEKVYAAERIFDPFVERISGIVEGLKTGDPLDPDTEIGPQATDEGVERCVRLLEEAVERGAEVIVGGEVKGRMMRPTLIKGVSEEMALMSEETLGPILAVAPFKGREEAVKLVNSTSLGLHVSIWTSDPAKAAELAEEVRAGTVIINDVIFTLAEVECPWGGVGGSGFGRVHGEPGLLETCYLKHISYDGGAKKRMPWWFPYDDRYRQLMTLYLERRLGSLASRWREVFRR